MATHLVQTTHIQKLIENGLDLAQRCNNTGQAGKTTVTAPLPMASPEARPGARVVFVCPEHGWLPAVAGSEEPGARYAPHRYSLGEGRFKGAWGCNTCQRDTPPIEVREVPVEHALQKAAADLRHAAEELEAERLSCLGWPQV